MEEILNTAQAAKYLGISKTTIERYRTLGIGPAYIKLGPRFIRYRPSDLDQWITDNIRK